jgi:dTDP-L-rhamnose 4-epimerase
VDESAPLEPGSVYAATKVAQEHLAYAWALGTGGSVTALRYHNVYGYGMPRDTPYCGVAAIFRSALEAGRPPQVFEDDRQRRDFIHVHDVAAANVKAAETDRGGFHASSPAGSAPATCGTWSPHPTAHARSSASKRRSGSPRACGRSRRPLRV